MPLDVLIVQTEGSLGYILQQELLNHLRIRRAGKYVVTMTTQVLVDKDNPAFEKPTKLMGPFYMREESDRMLLEHPNWRMVEDAGRSYQRTFPSSEPKRIIQNHMIRALVYIGIEAVIDKDLSSALLAMDIKADLFVVLTGVTCLVLPFIRLLSSDQE